MSPGKENKGMSLLKKGKKSMLTAIFSRFGLIAVLLVVQVAVVFGIFEWFNAFLPHIYGGSVLLSVFMVLLVLNSKHDPTSKITWLIVIMLLPVFGSLLYLFVRSDIGHRALKKRVNQINDQTKNTLPQSIQTAEHLKETAPGVAALAHYIRRNGGGNVFENTRVTYFPVGEAKFQELLRQLEKAEEFIFLEYFIVEEGVMWGQVLEILARKAAQGVDVRLMYDGTCEFARLPHDYPQMLEGLGIKCKMFAPISPFVSTHYNYRDHRKILVIDGHTAFNGGINLADEYINHIQKFGHWKDTAVMVEGEAARGFTLMFLQMWSIDERELDFDRFINVPARTDICSEGFVIPYGDCPLDSERVGEQVYIDILNRAQRYVHIMTPYLILDGEMESALQYAAERGVEVSLILPGIPDKKIPYGLAYTHYASLMESGIKIYEYTPGFVHAKSFVCDDREAVVGTINLDYRSLYHHFECATYMYGTDSVADVERDFVETREKCRFVTRQVLRNEKFSRKAVGFVMKAVAPLL